MSEKIDAMLLEAMARLPKPKPLAQLLMSREAWDEMKPQFADPFEALPEPTVTFNGMAVGGTEVVLMPGLSHDVAYLFTPPPPPDWRSFARLDEAGAEAPSIRFDKVGRYDDIKVSKLSGTAMFDVVMTPEFKRFVESRARRTRAIRREAATREMLRLWATDVRGGLGPRGRRRLRNLKLRFGLAPRQLRASRRRWRAFTRPSLGEPFSGFSCMTMP